jgi:hypothetical protein
VSERRPPDPIPPLAARWGRAFGLVASLALLLIAPVPLCPTRNWLHLPCPGCGATRATWLALQGDWAGSLRMHPLAMVVGVLMVPSGLITLRGIVREGVPAPMPRPLRWIWYLVAGALVAVWLARFAGFFGGPVPI